MAELPQDSAAYGGMRNVRMSSRLGIIVTRFLCSN